MHKLLLICSLLLLLLAGCGGGPGAPDGPRITISGLDAGDVVDSARTFVVDVEADAGVLSMNVDYGTVQSFNTDFGGVTEVSFDYEVGPQNSAPGANTLVVTARDLAGDTATVTLPFTVIDLPPVVTVSLQEGTLVTDNTPVLMSMSDDVGVAFISFDVNGELSSAEHDPPQPSIEIDNLRLNFDRLLVGENVLTVVARDTAGQTTTHTVHFFTPL